MPDSNRIRKGPLVALTIVVCVAGTLVGGCLGSAASAMYIQYQMSPPPQTVNLSSFGGGLGIISGLAAGFIWCQVMIARSVRKPRGKYVRPGARVGAGVGAMSALFVHIGLMMAVGRIQLQAPLAGLLFGVVAGYIVGAMCGAICQGQIAAACPHVEDEETESSH